MTVQELVEALRRLPGDWEQEVFFDDGKSLRPIVAVREARPVPGSAAPRPQEVWLRSFS